MGIVRKLQTSIIGRLYCCFTYCASKYLFSLLVLFMRVWMAKIFFYSGLSKLSSWDTTLLLFKHEYMVPIIPPEIAALMATATELTAPILLVIGFMSRLAAIPMLCMVAVIQFTYLDLIEHLYWAVLLGTIILYGPGRLSLDCLICCKIGKCEYGRKN